MVSITMQENVQFTFHLVWRPQVFPFHVRNLIFIYLFLITINETELWHQSRVLSSYQIVVLTHIHSICFGVHVVSSTKDMQLKLYLAPCLTFMRNTTPKQADQFKHSTL